MQGFLLGGDAYVKGNRAGTREGQKGYQIPSEREREGRLGANAPDHPAFRKSLRKSQSNKGLAKPSASP